LIGAGSVVATNAQIPPRVVAVGAPAKEKKPLDGDALAWVENNANEYVELARRYRAEAIDKLTP